MQVSTQFERKHWEPAFLCACLCPRANANEQTRLDRRVVKAKMVHVAIAVYPPAFRAMRPPCRNGHQIFRSYRQDSECEHSQQDPKGGELCLATAKPWETVVDAGSSTDVQIVCQSMGIGAKDSSNHLVAGFLRSFPQDRWSVFSHGRGMSLVKTRAPTERIVDCKSDLRFLSNSKGPRADPPWYHHLEPGGSAKTCVDLWSVT